MVSTLPFHISPQFLEDLGVNLYTSLDKVLVEFIANAYDADAKKVNITLDVNAIDLERRKINNRWKEEIAENSTKTPEDRKNLHPLESRTLDEEHKIVIEDNGDGMSLSDLREKFLQVSRRKRANEGGTSPNGRAFMGRKGLGKLAGFGVAQKIVVTSLKKGAPHATRITLDYNEIKKFTNMAEVEVPCETLVGKDNLRYEHGTRIELTKLVYTGLAGKQETALRKAIECFWMVDTGDFIVEHNENPVSITSREYDWAYPNEEGRPPEQLIFETVTLAGAEYRLRYRIRFTPSKKQLSSHECGVRIYAHKRLAATPSLFEIPSSSTGYKYTAYMDGAIVADFIDDQETDYIGTNRQGLRWETPLLEDLREWIQTKIKASLTQYYDSKEETLHERVSKDEFTLNAIKEANLPKHREKLAINIAVALAKGDSDEMASSFYKKSLRVVIQGLSKGDILSAISKLAQEESPVMADVLKEITELTKQEFGDFLSIVQGRIDGITALKKIYDNQDFRKHNDEKELQKLFEKNPWLIDPTFFQFMSADETQASLDDRLARHLEIGKHSKIDPTSDDEIKPFGANKRPDLSFLLGNVSLAKVVIVELKAPNTPLHIDHLLQLTRYIRRTQEFLNTHFNNTPRNFQVRGILIGSRATEEESRMEKVKDLRYEEEKRGDNAEWQILSIAEVLDRTSQAHIEILQAHKKARDAAS